MNRFKARLKSAGCILLVIFCLPTLVAAQKIQPGDWPGFLGPQRNGISNETNLIDAFPADGPKELWRMNLGGGMSSVAIMNGVLTTLDQDDTNQFVRAFDAKTGEPLWKQAIAPFYKNSMGNGPRATPTMHKDRVFVYSGEGILAALNAKDGRILWKKNLPQELNCKPSEYGMSCSPLIVGDTIVVQVGETGTLVAVSQSTGAVAWKTGTDPAGYSSPVLISAQGNQPQAILAFSGASALATSTSGKLLWRYAYDTDYFCNTATPVMDGPNILISAGENHGSTLLDVSSGQPKEAWSSLGRKSTLRAEWQTPVLLNGHVFGFDNVGSAGPVTHLTCVNFKTGKQAWQKSRFGKGNLTAADGKLFISTMKGELIIVKASTAEFSELARAKVIGTTRQAPVISHGRLYLRGDNELVCFHATK